MRSWIKSAGALAFVKVADALKITAKAPDFDFSTVPFDQCATSLERTKAGSEVDFNAVVSGSEKFTDDDFPEEHAFRWPDQYSTVFQSSENDVWMRAQ